MAEEGSTRVVLAAMAANFGIAAAKLGAATYTGSSAMLAEAVHSLIDTSNQGLLLYGMRRAQRPADALHPFGYARELYFWSFVVAVLLFSLGAGVAIYEGVEKLKHPHPVSSPHINYIVLAVAFALEATSCWVALTAFNKQRGDIPFLAALRKTKDAALITVLLEDLAAMVGLVIAFVGIAAMHLGDLPQADGIASIVIGLVLASVAAFIAVEVKSLLMGEAASDELQDGVRDILASEIGIGGLRAVGDLKTIQLGTTSVLAAATLDVAADVPAGEIEATTARLQQQIKARFPEIKHVYLELAIPARVELETKSASPQTVAQSPSRPTAETSTPGHKSQVLVRQDGKRGHGKRRR